MEHLVADLSRQPGACGQPSPSSEPLTADLLRRELRALDLGSKNDVHEVLCALKDLKAELHDMCLNTKTPVQRPLQSICELPLMSKVNSLEAEDNKLSSLDELQFAGFRRASIADMHWPKSRHEDFAGFRRASRSSTKKASKMHPHSSARPSAADHASTASRLSKPSRKHSITSDTKAGPVAKSPSGVSFLAPLSSADLASTASRLSKPSRRQSTLSDNKAGPVAKSTSSVGFLKRSASKVLDLAFGGATELGRISESDKGNVLEVSKGESSDAVAIVPTPPGGRPPQMPGVVPEASVSRNNCSGFFGGSSRSGDDADSLKSESGAARLKSAEVVEPQGCRFDREDDKQSGSEGAGEGTPLRLQDKSQTGGLSFASSKSKIACFAERESVDVSESDTDSESSVSSAGSGGGGGRCQRACHSIVTCQYFDQLFGVLVTLNALSIGVQVDISARAEGQQPPDVFRVTEWIFFVAFAAEVLLRLSAHHMSFFRGPGWRWNVFDCIVVLSQLVEEAVSYVAIHTAPSGLPSNLQFMRTIRLLRIVRLVRVVRILHLVKELQTIVLSVASSMRSLLWTMVLLLVIIFTVAVYFTQQISEQRIIGVSDSEAEGRLTHYYGGMGLSLLTLYEAITGGVEWNNVVRPLFSELGPISGLLFVLYVAFSVLALMNTVTGVFVESALKSAKEHHDTFLLAQVQQLFTCATTNATDGGGMVTWEKFEAQLEHTFMHEFFRAIDVEISEAESLFRLLDVDDCGALDLHQLMDGCFRLQGPARAIDLSLLMHDSRRASRKFLSHLGIIEYQLKNVQTDLTNIQTDLANIQTNVQTNE